MKPPCWQTSTLLKCYKARHVIFVLQVNGAHVNTCSLLLIIKCSLLILYWDCVGDTVLESLITATSECLSFICPYSTKLKALTLTQRLFSTCTQDDIAFEHLTSLKRKNLRKLDILDIFKDAQMNHHTKNNQKKCLRDAK